MADKPKVRQTLLQKKAIKVLVEEGGTVSGAMRKAGYSANTARTPSKLTDSPGFQAAMERAGITDEKLTKVLDEGLDATKAVVMGTKSDESFVDIQPDFAVRHKYLETAVKLKGYMNTDETSKGTTYNTYIQQNNLNPNAPDAKDLVESTLNNLMEQMKRGQGTAES